MLYQARQIVSSLYMIIPYEFLCIEGWKSLIYVLMKYGITYGFIDESTRRHYKVVSYGSS